MDKVNFEAINLDELTIKGVSAEKEEVSSYQKELEEFTQELQERWKLKYNDNWRQKNKKAKRAASNSRKINRKKKK